MITKFRGEYDFLSNFSYSKICIGENAFLNAEAAFHSFKDLNRQEEFCLLKPLDAKRKGRTVKLREDWEEIKDSIMFEVIKAKFSQNDDLRLKLLATGDEYIIEENHWHDNYYGNCTCNRCSTIIGGNVLGDTIMRVRMMLNNCEI